MSEEPKELGQLGESNNQATPWATGELGMVVDAGIDFSLLHSIQARFRAHPVSCLICTGVVLPGFEADD